MSMVRMARGRVDVEPVHHIECVDHQWRWRVISASNLGRDVWNMCVTRPRWSRHQWRRLAAAAAAAPVVAMAAQWVGSQVSWCSQPRDDAPTGLDSSTFSPIFGQQQTAGLRWYGGHMSLEEGECSNSSGRTCWHATPYRQGPARCRPTSSDDVPIVLQRRQWLPAPPPLLWSENVHLRRYRRC